MQFRVNSKVLEKLLSKIIPAVPVRTPMPILENFLFDIHDGSLTVCATDMEISLRSSLNVNADENIKMVVPARLLFDIIRNLEETQILFETKENSKLKLSTDTGVYNIGYSSSEDYPDIPAVEPSINAVIGGMDLKKAFEHTSFAMSKEDMRPAMTGTLFEFSPNGLNFVATDGHRLVRYINKSIEADAVQQYVVPERAISVLAKILTDNDVKIYFSKTNISFQTDDLELISRLIGEKYPAYSSVIPLENENILKANTNTLLSSIKRMMIFSATGTKQVKFTISKDNMHISAEDIDHGSDAMESVPCEYNGEPMSIGFNTAYMNDMLTHIFNDEVIFKLHSPTKACILEPASIGENEELLLLLMPVRLNN